MSDPIYGQATGTAGYLVAVAAVEPTVYAYVAKPILPIIELLVDSLSAPTDTVDVSPTAAPASSVSMSDEVHSNYPTPFLTNTAANDQMQVQLAIRVNDNLTPSDSFTHS